MQLRELALTLSVCVNVLVFLLCFFVVQQSATVSERLYGLASQRDVAETPRPGAAVSSNAAAKTGAPASDGVFNLSTRLWRSRQIVLSKAAARRFRNFRRYENVTVDAYARSLFNRAAGACWPTVPRMASKRIAALAQGRSTIGSSRICPTRCRTDLAVPHSPKVLLRLCFVGQLRLAAAKHDATCSREGFWFYARTRLSSSSELHKYVRHTKPTPIPAASIY